MFEALLNIGVGVESTDSESQRLPAKKKIKARGKKKEVSDSAPHVTTTPRPKTAPKKPDNER